MGYDSEKREIGMGMLAEKTHPYIRDKVKTCQIYVLRVNLILLSQVVEMLVAQGFSQWEATEVELMQHAPHIADCPCPIQLIIP